ncbi:MAG: helix-turn-helix domain-containing protein [Erysipelotrichaceae bacterium]|nr:helix-turn-helix domain-containing protein [Erysipelotrichaceae bacterium]
MNIRELRMSLGDTQSDFAMRYRIPFRTIQNWEAGIRKPPEYMMELLKQRVENDLINRKTFKLPEFSPKKKNLPQRKDYLGSLSWLKAVSEVLGNDTVFALDEALMIQGHFGGRNDEYLVWVYGDDSLRRFNGVVVIGNQISSDCIKENNGIKYTDFSRTLYDSFANENILDMQGITEALSHYYYSHNESFEGISIAPEYQRRFENLAEEAIDDYRS